MVRRRIPKITDLAPLMHVKTPELNARKRRLEGALTIHGLRTLAKKRTPKAAFDYTEGECAGAHAAAQASIPFALSTMGTTSIEDVQAANPRGRNWFQLYMWKDRDRSMALVERAARSGGSTF